SIVDCFILILHEVQEKSCPTSFADSAGSFSIAVSFPVHGACAARPASPSVLHGPQNARVADIRTTTTIFSDLKKPSTRLCQPIRNRADIVSGIGKDLSLLAGSILR